MGFIWLQLGRYSRRNAAIKRFIRLQFGSLRCCHAAGISLIRLGLARLLYGCAVGISLICVKLDSLLCSGAGIRLVPVRVHSNPLFNGLIGVKTTFLTKTRNKTYLRLHFNPLISGPIRVRTTFLFKTGNKFDLFRTGQAALQSCCENSSIFLELDRFLRSDAATISFIHLESDSLFCSHVAGLGLIL